MYDLPADILATLVPKTELQAEITESTHSTIEGAHPNPQRNDTSTEGSKACSLCQITFHTVAEQRGHIRSDWHGYNLKQKLRCGAAISEDDFEKLVEGMIRHAREIA